MTVLFLTIIGVLVISLIDLYVANKSLSATRGSEIQVKYLTPAVNKISMPRPGDLGIDLYASEDIDILKGEYKLVPTGVALELPEGIGLLIKDRSSVSKKCHVMAGVIDTSYRGELKIALYCHGVDVFRIQKGDKIAQGLLVEDLNSKFNLVEVDELSSTERGVSGFGSTGR
jgi:dUTP pyrophosphatase